MSAAATLGLGACVTPIKELADPTALPAAKVNPGTHARDELMRLPGPAQRIAIAVYNFEDQTGQFKPTSASQTLSRAVTQGGGSVLAKALQDAGNRRWFDVVERENLNNLLNERNIIREMRQRYLGEDTVNPQALPPLMFAGILLEGGIIGYDSNTRTGGLGARYLGIGGATEYREDTVTVYLRAVSTKTGAVLSNVTTEQRIASVGLSGNAFRFVAFQELLEIDAGVTSNQPTQLAVQQAVEKAVYALVVDGIDTGLWAFADPVAGEAAIAEFREKTQPWYVAKTLRENPELAKVDSGRVVRSNTAAPAEVAAEIANMELAAIKMAP